MNEVANIDDVEFGLEVKSSLGFSCKKKKINLFSYLKFSPETKKR